MPTNAIVAADNAPVDLAVSTDPHSLAAYNGLLDEARAIPRDELLQLNLDVPVAATTCIAVARRVAQHRAWFASLPTYDIGSFRQRMFTLAVGRYDQVRRGAMFMRWNEDDVDEFVPSLFAKGPRRSEKDDKGNTAAGKVTPVTPGPAPGPGATPATPAARPAGGGPIAPDDDGPNSRPFINR